MENKTVHMQLVTGLAANIWPDSQHPASQPVPVRLGSHA